MIPIVHTTQEIYHVIPTNGSMPVMVQCSDWEDYICKYKSPGFQPLVKEFLASQFLKIWEIPTPEIAFVQFELGHLPQHKITNRQNFKQFESLCFGSKVMKNVDDFSPDLMKAAPASKMDRMLEDFIRVAAFDIWLGNDDRTPNNPNLLIQLDQDRQRRLVAIDHAALFNTGFLERPLYELSLEDSILYAPLFNQLFRHSRKGRWILQDELKHFQTAVAKCHSNLQSIISQIPTDWLPGKLDFETKCQSALFAPDWIKRVRDTLCTFVASSEKP
jgi:hypothetical protein